MPRALVNARGELESPSSIELDIMKIQQLLPCSSAPDLWEGAIRSEALQAEPPNAASIVVV